VERFWRKLSFHAEEMFETAGVTCNCFAIKLVKIAEIVIITLTPDCLNMHGL
jgi:hypothetical protein